MHCSVAELEHKEELEKDFDRKECRKWHHDRGLPHVSAGWGPVGLTWAYAILTWLVTDLAKVITQKVFRSQAKIKEACKLDESSPPTWVRVVDTPGRLAERAADGIEAGMEVRQYVHMHAIPFLLALCRGQNFT